MPAHLSEKITLSDQGGLADEQGLYQRKGTTNFGALEQKVVNLEGWISDIKHDIKDLNDGIKGLTVSILTLNRPQWVPLIAAATLFCAVTGGVWGLAISPVRGDLDRVTASVDKLKEEIVPRSEHMQRDLALQQQMDRDRHQVDVIKEQLERAVRK